MDRLTYKSYMGDYGSNKEYDSVYDEIADLRNRLGQYEDTGLEPCEISVKAEDCAATFIDELEKFKIPPEIEVKIPSYFIASFAGELVSVFGRDIFLIDPEGNYNVWWYTGKGGWRDAFQAVCKKLNLEWLYEYREKLEWYDSDNFDYIIAERVCDFLENPADSANAYCNYIREREKYCTE